MDWLVFTIVGIELHLVVTIIAAISPEKLSPYRVRACVLTPLPVGLVLCLAIEP
jgi:hypothetical protein